MICVWSFGNSWCHRQGICSSADGSNCCTIVHMGRHKMFFSRIFLGLSLLIACSGCEVRFTSRTFPPEIVPQASARSSHIAELHATVIREELKTCKNSNPSVQWKVIDPPNPLPEPPKGAYMWCPRFFGESFWANNREECASLLLEYDLKVARQALTECGSYLVAPVE